MASVFPIEIIAAGPNPVTQVTITERVITTRAANGQAFFRTGLHRVQNFTILKKNGVADDPFTAVTRVGPEIIALPGDSFFPNKNIVTGCDMTQLPDKVYFLRVLPGRIQATGGPENVLVYATPGEMQVSGECCVNANQITVTEAAATVPSRGSVHILTLLSFQADGTPIFFKSSSPFSYQITFRASRWRYEVKNGSLNISHMIEEAQSPAGPFPPFGTYRRISGSAGGSSQVQTAVVSA